MVRGDAPARSYDLKTSVSWSKTWLRESDSWNLTKIRQRQAQRSWTSEPVAGRGPGSKLDAVYNSWAMRWMQCRKWFHGSSMEGMMGATHEWILSILEVYDKGLIKAWLGRSWPFMTKKAHDLVRS
ncbi:hypothetical protein F2Q70_00009842 [Brassica cretica]|uniref:Uncharacterized protein n=1 Tax=Brassica cretica TaxID=69181 RepID=A0A8S9LUT6_BRACR|nr:hypothetical protein F2Q70_00009842 [Brassica cretica]